MLVEDDNSLREIYQARLMAEGYETVAAKDGEEALALVGKEKPDLIILDIMMPKISGFDTLDILRSTPATKYTKVIMMSALSQAEDKTRAEKLGADKYLVKSQVTLEDIVKTVKEVLESEETKAEDLSAPGAPTTVGGDTPAAVPTDDNVSVDNSAVPPPTVSTSDATSSNNQDLSNVEAEVNKNAESTDEEVKTINNEESNDMNQDNTTPNPTPDATPAPDATTPATDAVPTTEPTAVPSTDDSQVSSDPSPLTDAPATDASAPASDAAPADGATSDPSVGGTKVVDPISNPDAQKSRLQELLDAEDSKGSAPATDSGSSDQTPPPPAA